MQSKSDHNVPKRAHTIGMYIFLAALGMLFFASMLGYVLIRTNWGTSSLGSLVLPKSLFVSTALMLAASATIHLSLNAIRRERRDAFRTFLTATIIFAALFICVQTPAMVNLYQRHVALAQEYERERASEPAATQSITQRFRPSNSSEDEIIPEKRPVPYYALVMVLILVHALHVVGGIVSLGIVAYNGYRDRYDHEDYSGVRNCVLYWHFLDGVWIFMFTVIAAFK